MPNEIQYILYNPPDETGKVQIIIRDETIWCTQKVMAQLFGVGVPTVSKHQKHIFEEGGLDENVVVSFLEVATQHGAIEGKTQQKETKFYSLDAIHFSLPNKERVSCCRSKSKGGKRIRYFQ